MITFIKRYLFDDLKLRDRALLELTRGLRDGRLIALTGAMSTEALGYFSWRALCEQFAEVAASQAGHVRALLGGWADTDPQAVALLGIIERHGAELKQPSGAVSIDNRVHFSVVREAFDALEALLLLHGVKRPKTGAGSRAPREEFDEEFAKRFRARQAVRGGSPIEPLLESLGIARFVTLNYDFELERSMLLREDEREQLEPGASPQATFLDFVGGVDAQHPISLDAIHRMSRVHADGLTVESDTLNRERVDRLIEFAVGSANVDRHILHLHGRADRPESMILDIRDYDRLYRRDDLYKNPFEYGLRVLFAGNPVLFVGVGMSEAEVNLTLQAFVSDSPYRRTAPAFLLWNTQKFESDPTKRAEEKRLMRIDFLQRLGVFVIFDDDIAWRDPSQLEAFRTRTQALRKEIDAEKEGANPDPKRLAAAEKEMLGIALGALRQIVLELPAAVGRTEALGNRAGNAWRDTNSRANAGCDRPVRLWGTPQLAGWASLKSYKAIDGALSTAQSAPVPDGTAVFYHENGHGSSRADSAEERSAGELMVGLSIPGFGRGLLAEWLIQTGPVSFGPWSFGSSKPCDRLLVNAGFSYDSDALLSGIADFLWARNMDKMRPRPCREIMFSSGLAFRTTDQTLIIINGIDRFFGFDGAPLSAEFDHLIRCILKTTGSNVRWLLLGTDRLRRYLDALQLPSYFLAASPLAPNGAPERQPPPVALGSRYLHHVAKRFEDDGATVQPAGLAKLEIAARTSRDAVRRAFFSAYLAPAVLGMRVDAPIALQVLRTMAFIGWPVETGVLLHAPKIVAILNERLQPMSADRTRFEAKLIEVMRELHSLGLVIEVARFDADSHSQQAARFEATRAIDLQSRFGLHRALATELRERYGVPLSEAKLSSTFNMSLFAAQPADDYMPEARFHDELGELVDRLIGAWKDEADIGGILDPRIVAILTSAGEAFAPAAALRSRYASVLANHPKDASITLARFAALCSPRAVACLRAALAVIRGYYSTSNLLSLDRNDRLVSPARDGALTEHSDRLDRLLKGFGKIATARRIVREIIEEYRLPEDLIKPLGPEPLYPDDLVWLHNERGVVKLAQGDLYGARRSLSLALDSNDSLLEGGHRGHNWRRITMNAVGVLIERGRLRSAENKLDEIEATIDGAEWSLDQSFKDGGGETHGRMWRIVDTYGQQDGFIDDCTSRHFTREEILMAGLVTGYRGLIAQNRGREKTAKGLYERGISILRRLGEQRAYALFQRHYASLRRFTRDPGQGRIQVDLAVATADAAHQMDMSYRARLLRADAVRRSPSNAMERRQALDDITRALDYAALTDSYRVRIEASSSLARAMLESGEFDAALKHACDALAVACRFGHSLHKVSLRIQIGEILIQRGDPKSGNALLDQALNLSTRIGYQRIVERVQRARQTGSPIVGIVDVDRN